jgi:hypothetical protein
MSRGSKIKLPSIYISWKTVSESAHGMDEVVEFITYTAEVVNAVKASKANMLQRILSRCPDRVRGVRKVDSVENSGAGICIVEFGLVIITLSNMFYRPSWTPRGSENLIAIVLALGSSCTFLGYASC